MQVQLAACAGIAEKLGAVKSRDARNFLSAKRGAGDVERKSSKMSGNQNTKHENITNAILISLSNFS